MHIPQGDTAAMEILSFEEAAERSTSEDYDRDKWLYVPDFYTEYRYVLGTRGEYPVICAGINPSTAEPDNLDPTLKSVSRIAAANAYAQRATRPDDMDRERNELLHHENMEAFRTLLQLAACSGRKPIVWAAWGAIIEKRFWLMDCVRDMYMLGEDFGALWVCAGKCSKAGHPHHPLYLRKDELFHPFDMGGYLR